MDVPQGDKLEIVVLNAEGIRREYIELRKLRLISCPENSPTRCIFLTSEKIKQNKFSF
jgi:hypothetical protein